MAIIYPANTSVPVSIGPVDPDDAEKTTLDFSALSGGGQLDAFGIVDVSSGVTIGDGVTQKQTPLPGNPVTPAPPIDNGGILTVHFFATDPVDPAMIGNEHSFTAHVRRGDVSTSRTIKFTLEQR